jgi:hypothetical protein
MKSLKSTAFLCHDGSTREVQGGGGAGEVGKEEEEGSFDMSYRGFWLYFSPTRG